MVEIFGKDVLNTEFKKESQIELKRSVNDYNQAMNTLNSELVSLQVSRDALSTSLNAVERLINEIKNTPTHFDKQIKQLKVKLEDYNMLLSKSKIQANKIDREYKAEKVLSGIALAQLGGPALTALAVSTGTVETGAVASAVASSGISSILALFVGCGALGLAGGAASILGPAGWIAGGIIANGKNKETAAKLYDTAKKLSAATKKIELIANETDAQTRIVVNSSHDLADRVTRYNYTWPNDFDDFSEDQKEEAGTLVNNTITAEKVLNANLEESGKFTEMETPETKLVPENEFGTGSWSSDTQENKQGIYGKVLSTGSSVGQIEANSGDVYTYHNFNVKDSIEVGQKVQFDGWNDEAREIHPVD